MPTGSLRASSSRSLRSTFRIIASSVPMRSWPPGSINSQVITRLMDAKLVIADMSMHNANAFYELAIRHMVRLPTIHIIHKDWKVPFDVAPFRAIQFARDDIDDVEAAKTALKITIDEVIRDGFQ